MVGRFVISLFKELKTLHGLAITSAFERDQREMTTDDGSSHESRTGEASVAFGVMKIDQRTI